MFTLHLFGGASLAPSDNGSVAPVTQQRRLAVLALLATHPDGAVSREKLVGYLWPEKPPARARHRLADSVYGLRKALGKETIVSAGGNLRLDRERVTSDVRRFEEAMDRRAFRRAVELYRGPFLDGFFVRRAPRFGRWAEEERRRFGRLLAGALEELARRAEAEGDRAAAIRWRRTLVDHDPYDSTAVLRLMETLDRAGDPAAAVREAETYAARFLDDLELEPAPPVLALASRLRKASVPGSSGASSPSSGLSTDPEAHDAYMRGRHLLYRRTRQSMTRAIECFEHAIERDPSYGRAYAGLAETYLVLGSGQYTVLPPDEAVERARENAEKAIEIDGSLAEAHVSLGIARMHQWDFRGAEERLRRAVDLDPENPGAHHRYGWLLALTGELEAGLEEVERAQALAPLVLPIRTAVGRIYEFMRRPDEAIVRYREILELDPTYSAAHFSLGSALLQKGMEREAVSALRRGREHSGTPGVTALLAFGLARAGQREEARAILDELLELREREHVGADFIGDIYMALGETDEGFAWYERAYEEHSPALMYLKVEPLWDPMRGDPRYEHLLERVGLEDVGPRGGGEPWQSEPNRIDP